MLHVVVLPEILGPPQVMRIHAERTPLSTVARQTTRGVQKCPKSVHAQHNGARFGVFQHSKEPRPPLVDKVERGSTMLGKVARPGLLINRLWVRLPRGSPEVGGPLTGASYPCFSGLDALRVSQRRTHCPWIGLRGLQPL